ncbi:MAG: NAD(P)-dependent alcohol dehydrogenase [Desulfobulbaceae bacterium]|nr:MAG: NAD(P)-dependent alcohol dehydrogenase [Desulfobulbaceae bacterium]
MKVIVYDTYGLPDVLRLEDIPEPSPGDDEVLVKIYAVSINSWDWDMLTGRPLEYRMLSGLVKPKSNLLHGCDITGEVKAVGKNVRELKIGDEVFGDLSEGGWGAFAEYRCVRENEVIKKPANISFQQAACLPHGGNLAVQGLIDFGRISSGQNVLINGGGGSTGTLAIQIAKSFNTQVTAVDHTVKLDFMRTLGADQVIDYTKEDFTQNTNQYDLIFDVKTDRSVFAYKRALKQDGIYVSVGGKTSRILQLVTIGKLLKNCQMHMVGYKANKDLNYLIELFEANKLKPVIDKSFPLEETAQAFQYFGEGQFKGKVVVTMG